MTRWIEKLSVRVVTKKRLLRILCDDELGMKTKKKGSDMKKSLRNDVVRMKVRQQLRRFQSRAAGVLVS